LLYIHVYIECVATEKPSSCPYLVLSCFVQATTTGLAPYLERGYCFPSPSSQPGESCVRLRIPLGARIVLAPTGVLSSRTRLPNRETRVPVEDPSRRPGLPLPRTGVLFSHTRPSQPKTHTHPQAEAPSDYQCGPHTRFLLNGGTVFPLPSSQPGESCTDAG
jgi:hypothetical protein